MVYFHVCLPHSTGNDFRTPPPLANLATFCEILRYPFLKTLACHLPENCHNNKRNLDECEVNGAPGVVQCEQLESDLIEGITSQTLLEGWLSTHTCNPHKSLLKRPGL